MTLLLRVLAVIACVLFSTGASAGTAHLACVQQGLLDAGYDPNGIDGSLGGGTRAAAAAFLNSSELELAELTENNSQDWCIALGATTFVVDLQSSGEFDGFLTLDLFTWFMEHVASIEDQQFMMLSVNDQNLRTATVSASDWAETSHVIVFTQGDGWTDATDWDGSQYNIANTKAAPTPGPDGLHHIVIRMQRE